MRLLACWHSNTNPNYNTPAAAATPTTTTTTTTVLLYNYSLIHYGFLINALDFSANFPICFPVVGYTVVLLVVLIVVVLLVVLLLLVVVVVLVLLDNKQTGKQIGNLAEKSSAFNKKP